MTDSPQNILVVIPARGGSKRIPYKNITPVNGQPMIYWPLMVLSQMFRACDVLVSTDSIPIKLAVEAKGLQVPFLRPDKLADDFSGTTEVVTHALNWFEENVRKVDYVLTVYPTAVLIAKNDILDAMQLLAQDPIVDSIMSATTFPFPIQRAIFTNDKGYAEMFQPGNYPRRSQDFTVALHDAGQFYFSKAEAVRNGKNLTNSHVKLYVLPRTKVIDIDTHEDLEVAAEKLSMYRNPRNLSTWHFDQ